MVICSRSENISPLLNNLHDDALDRKAGTDQDRTVVRLRRLGLQDPIVWKTGELLHRRLTIHMGDNDCARFGRGLLADENQVSVLDLSPWDLRPVHRLAVDPQEEELGRLRGEILDWELKPAIVILLGEVEAAGGDTPEDGYRSGLRPSRGAADDLESPSSWRAADEAAILQLL